MKYVLLMQGGRENWSKYAGWPSEDLKHNFDFLRQFNAELHNSGIFVDTKELAWPQEAKLVRADDNGEPVIESVFPDGKEFLAGYWVIDVESPEQAYKIAARASAVPGLEGRPENLPIEVRRLLDSRNDLES